MNKKIKNFILGIAAGIFIGMGGASNLVCINNGSRIAGALMFSVGLVAVCILETNLFTGKVGYILENDKEYLIDVLIMAVGNIIGAAVFGYLFALCVPNLPASSNLRLLWDYTGETNDNLQWLKMILLSIMAGAFVFIAVHGYKNGKSGFERVITIVLSISAMVLLSGNHSIANVFYFSYNQMSADINFLVVAVPSIIVTCIFNSVGSIVTYLLTKKAF